MIPRRGRPPKPPDEVRRIRVTVLLNDHEDATLSRACGGRGVATMLREAGMREAAAMAPRVIGEHPRVYPEDSPFDKAATLGD